MDDAHVLERAFAAYGGRIDTSKLDLSIADRFNHVAARARLFLKTAAAALPAMPPIYFDFIDRWDLNAVAFRNADTYFIGFNRGTVATLTFLFDRMLADPRILEFVGDPKEESDELPLIPAIGANFKKSVDSVPLFHRPRNSARILTANKLVELALDFLTAHEFSHIANGHVDYIHDTEGLSAIDEVSKPAQASTTGDSALTRQAMEMDADATAVGISLGSELGKVCGLFPKPAPPWTEFYEYPGQVLFQWSWAVSALFRILGDARLDIGNATINRYPPARLRFVMTQQVAGRVPMPETLTTHYKYDTDEYGIPYAIKAAHHMVEEAFSKITGFPVTTEGLDEAWGDVGKSRIRSLRDFWQTNLRGKLLTFAHQPLQDYSD